MKMKGTTLTPEQAAAFRVHRWGTLASAMRMTRLYCIAAKDCNDAEVYGREALVLEALLAIAKQDRNDRMVMDERDEAEALFQAERDAQIKEALTPRLTAMRVAR